MDSNLINLIVEEVLCRLKEQTPSPVEEAGTLVVAASEVMAPQIADRILRQEFTNIQYAFLKNGADDSGNPGANKEGWNEKKLLTATSASENVVLLAPSVRTLENIASGQDMEFLELAMLRAILWGKKVYVMLDFEIPKFKRGTFFEKLLNALDALKDMGIQMITYQCYADQKQELLSLVTENEVMEAFSQKKNRIVCVKGAIVTPAAKDRAAELKIKIDW